MKKIDAPVDELAHVATEGRFSSKTLDLKLLQFFGIFVLKEAFDVSTLAKYAKSYFDEINGAKLKRTQHHLTEVKIDEGHYLRSIVNESEFVKVASNFFGGNVGVDFIRIVKKDKADIKPVFRHQDTCYQVGGFERYSLFIPLTDCAFENGGLILYPGTHHFGYLGDAGEILDVLPEGYPKICTDVKVGDVLVMHSATWHESPENRALTDRVYLEVHIQHIDEPTTKIPVCGERKSKWIFGLTENEIFRNSRTQRLRELYKEVESLKGVR